jgi:N-acetylglutamate synthase-like GNAT family acetyltransferase
MNSPDGDSITIRAATTRDCDGILQCLASAFAAYREAYTLEGFQDTVLTPETVLTRMAQWSIFVATAGSGEIVGTIACRLMEDGRGHLRGMAVRPEWHGSGVGPDLLRRAEEELRKAGCTRITLNTTEPLKRASHFYEKHGFRTTGNSRPWFGMTLFEYSKPVSNSEA